MRGSVGIGFSIPINQAKRLLPQLTAGKSVEHPWLGISGVAITPDIATEQQLAAKSGVLVAEVVANGPAQKAGLKGGSAANRGDTPVGGDIITLVDGKAIKTVQEISSYLDTLKVGDKVRLAVVRDGKPQEITVTLGAWQDAPTQPE
ncbi:MAG: PDZ domain-containing protein [Chloroflexi bacterium]|nr:PDZ domain-containing protein [Chloroflexota bacterium]